MLLVQMVFTLRRPKDPGQCKMDDAVVPLFCDRRGATSIEYALIAAFISLLIVGWATSIGQSVNGFFMDVANGF